MSFAIANMTGGQLNAIVKKLGGEEGALRFLRDELEVVAKAIVTVTFTAWKTLTVGSFKSLKEVKSAFKKAGMTLSDWASDILSKSSLGELGENQVEFVKVKISDLGFTEPTILHQILKRAQEQGLKLCEPEDGIALRLTYPDQPWNDIFWLGMEPVRDADGGWRVLRVGCDGGGLWLAAGWDDLGDVWNPGDEFVFRK